MLTKRSTCRLCLSRDVVLVYAMPACPPVDNYRFENEPGINLPAFPMDLYMCQSCGHAQLLDVVDPDILFGQYIYNSASSPDLERHFESYAEHIIEYAKLDSNSLVVDVGSNDGLLLAKFKKRGIQVQGIDPAKNVAQYAIDNGIPTIISFFNSSTVTLIKSTIGPADIVCANNVFSHSDDLRDFAKCARNLLKPSGFFVFEVSYLRDLVENKVIDYVYHEHLAHHSIRSLKTFFNSIDMRLFDVKRVATKGGSIRCFAAAKHSSWRETPVVEKLIFEENQMGLYSPEVYKNLKNEIDRLGVMTRSILNETIENGGTVASYGASATATVLTSLFDISESLAFIVDDNPERHGRLSPGHRVPVKSRVEFLELRPAVTFIAAWRFADMIIERNREYLNAGGKFIVPLPIFKVVTKSDYE